jgi:mannosyltransferase OCH1-like enzyme
MAMMEATAATAANKVVQGLWVGAQLSVMEQMSIASFLMNGHEYHLYVYEDVKQLPAGTVVKDGAEVLPASMIFQYRDFKSYSGFSNFFRYKLLLERGGWWVDTDMICLQPFDFPEEYVFSSEIGDVQAVTTSGAIKTPAGSPAMAYAWQVCREKKVENLVWGETGPRLIGEAVRLCSLENFKQPPEVFCPISYSDWRKVLEPVEGWPFRQTTYALHLWNEMWRRAGQDKNQDYHPKCLYEELKKRYLPR